jgi:hypothetical protein
MTGEMVALCREFVAIAGPRRHLAEEALGIPVEIAQPFGLQAIGDHAVEQMAGQMIGGLAAKHRMPSCPRASLMFAAAGPRYCAVRPLARSSGGRSRMGRRARRAGAERGVVQ